MVRLQTIATRAAPIAPVRAAAAPPPGVGLLDASRSRNASTVSPRASCSTFGSVLEYFVPRGIDVTVAYDPSKVGVAVRIRYPAPTVLRYQTRVGRHAVPPHPRLISQDFRTARYTVVPFGTSVP